MELTHGVIVFLIIAIVYLIRLVCILPFCHISKDIYGNVASQTEKTDAQIVNKGSNIENSGLLIKQNNLQLFIFLGSGGHTGEMLRLINNYSDILLNNDTTVHVGYSDEASKSKFNNCIKQMDCKRKYYNFKKAREVNSGILNSIQTIVLTLLTSLKHIITIKWHMLGKPHLVLLNGPGTCCIITVWCKLIDLFFLFTSSNIVYIESLARISTLSLTGKILYYLTDEFIVQWEELKIREAPEAKFFGILV